MGEWLVECECGETFGPFDQHFEAAQKSVAHRAKRENHMTGIVSADEK